jgi:DNA-binding MarR family transcriptional regulator
MALVQQGLDCKDLYTFCYQNPRGATEEELRAAGWKDKGALVQQINKLMGQGLIKAIPAGPPGSKVIYQAVDPNMAKKMHGLADDQLMVLQKIEDTQTEGAWSRSLQSQTRLSAPVVSKITKELLRRNLIKEVKSVQHRNRKVFMKFDLNPSEKLSGGRWYHNGEWDYEMVSWMTRICRDRMAESDEQPVCTRDIFEYVMQNPAPRRVQLSLDHVEDIMRALELDEEIVSIIDERGDRLYLERRQDGHKFNVFSARFPLRCKRRRLDDEGEPPMPEQTCPFLIACMEEAFRQRSPWLQVWGARGLGPHDLGASPLSPRSEPVL